MKPLEGKKVLFIICQENFLDEELAHPRPVVISGKIVTANGPPAARDFGKALVSTLIKG